MATLQIIYPQVINCNIKFSLYSVYSLLCFVVLHFTLIVRPNNLGIALIPGDASMPSILRVKQNTSFKQVWELQSQELKQIPENYTYSSQKGDEYPVVSIERYENDYYKNIVNQTTSEKLSDYWYVRFTKPLNGREIWYVFKQHVEEVRN